jgi:hypothetical protein
MFAAPEQFGLANRRPIPGYSYVFPLGSSELEKLAYFFDFDYGDGRQPGSYVADLIHEIEEWATLRRQQRVQLDLFQAGPVLLINDTRPCAVKRTHVLSGIAAKIYLLCDTFQTISGLSQKLDVNVVDHEISALLRGFLAAKLMIEMEGHYLSLAVMRNRADSVVIVDHTPEPNEQDHSTTEKPPLPAAV